VNSLSLFESDRMLLAESIRLTIESLRAYGAIYKNWAIAFSGGKDSATAVTLIADLIETGQIEPPKSLTVLYADTRMELPPLQISAMGILAELRERGIETRIVLPALDDRYFVYMLGRGVPPPKNRFRWCTSQIKIEPMIAALKDLRDKAGEKFLMLTGVRLGESAARDTRIITSCSRDGAECGQGWFQESTPDDVADTLAPLLHWRVCHIWAWLTSHAPDRGFPTTAIAAAYGGDEAEEINARTGCVGCPLASQDFALQAVIQQPDWAYLEPLRRLKPLYTELTHEHRHRLRKVDVELTADGKIGKNPQRVGPLSMEARKYALSVVIDVQQRVNDAARQLGRPQIDLLNQEEYERIMELIAANTWPRRWTGEEAAGDELIDRAFNDGTWQPLLGGIV
jgi:DNA sulfur modification protein DndC